MATASKASGQIAVTVNSAPGELTVELVDTAPPFNPAERHPARRIQTTPASAGLGLLIMHRVMDEIDYARRPNGNYADHAKGTRTGLRFLTPRLHLAHR